MGKQADRKTAPSGKTPGEWVRGPHTVAISARHLHLTESAIETLFCDKYRLHTHAELVQPGQYAAEESVTLIGPHGRIPHVRIVGPPRAVNQVELSAPMPSPSRNKHSGTRVGDLAGTPGIVLEGPRGSLTLIGRHLRAAPRAYVSGGGGPRLGLKDQDRIQVAAQSADRRTVFQNVVVRVSPTYRLEMHLDTDEGNAAGLPSGDHVVLQ